MYLVSLWVWCLDNVKHVFETSLQHSMTLRRTQTQTWSGYTVLGIMYSGRRLIRRFSRAVSGRATCNAKLCELGIVVWCLMEWSQRVTETGSGHIDWKADDSVHSNLCLSIVSFRNVHDKTGKVYLQSALFAPHLRVHCVVAENFLARLPRSVAEDDGFVDACNYCCLLTCVPFRQGASLYKMKREVHRRVLWPLTLRTIWQEAIFSKL